MSEQRWVDEHGTEWPMRIRKTAFPSIPLQTEYEVVPASDYDRERERAEKTDTATMLADFHAHPNALGEGTNTQAIRRTLHREEHEELMYELEAPERGEEYDLAQVARELADVVYVAYGSAWAFGIDLDAALIEVHRAGMDKMEAGYRREDGKIMKPPGFRPPDMSAALPEPAPGDTDG
jgi:NTP pyrophosphatase (non-canonical NTP hydrolase)